MMGVSKRSAGMCGEISGKEMKEKKMRQKKDVNVKGAKMCA